MVAGRLPSTKFHTHCVGFCDLYAMYVRMYMHICLCTQYFCVHSSEYVVVYDDTMQVCRHFVHAKRAVGDVSCVVFLQTKSTAAKCATNASDLNSTGRSPHALLNADMFSSVLCTMLNIRTLSSEKKSFHKKLQH